jgi:hypothetical protein
MENDFEACDSATEVIELANKKRIENWRLISVASCATGLVAFFEREVPDPPATAE